MATRDPPGQILPDGHTSSGSTQGTRASSADATESTTSNQLSQVLSIAVFRGDPIDAYIYRHVGLFIQTFRGATLITRNYLDVTGATGSFEKDESWERDPLQSLDNCGHVQVATSRPTSETDRDLRNTIWATPVKNNDRSWNCQNWVGDALQRCVDAGCITRAQMDTAIDGMVDILLEAPDMVD